MRLLMVDHDDSFTWNLVQLFLGFGLEVRVRRYGELDPALGEAWRPDWICLSPGPGAPREYPGSFELLRRWSREIPVLGVCLGLQIINEFFGGKTRRAPRPIHGRRSRVHHDGLGVLAGLPSPFWAARYHSLQIRLAGEEFVPLARSEDGVVMAAWHRSWPTGGVQFHPESFLSEHGPALVRNFLRLSPRFRDCGGVPPAAGPVSAPDPGLGAPPVAHRFPRRGVRLDGPVAVAGGVDDGRFLEEAMSRLDEPGTVLLLGGGAHEAARYSILGAKPFLGLRSKGRRNWLATAAGVEEIAGDPLAVLAGLESSLAPDHSLPVAPFSGGAMGYLAYELKNVLEPFPQSAADDLGLPELCLFFPGEVLVHDRRLRRLHRLRLAADGYPGPLPAAPLPSAPPPVTGELESNFSRPEYLAAVRQIRRAIAAGDVYQVNLTQRFSFNLGGDPRILWRRMFELNPAPFYAFVQAGDHQVLSTSMERFLWRRDNRVETRPIKGTRRRGRHPAEDRRLRAELRADPKEGAELAMIVDLLRNDLGRVCRAGSVRVAEARRIEAYRNVFHQVAVVEGELPPEVTTVELLRATFPGGSVTGCPKRRALEIIDTLEPQVRHAYTGAIGYLGWHRNLDLAVAIRTLVCTGGRAHFGAGGGVVYDSRPAAEYRETLYKARTLLQVVRELGAGEPDSTAAAEPQPNESTKCTKDTKFNHENMENTE